MIPFCILRDLWGHGKSWGLSGRFICLLESDVGGEGLCRDRCECVYGDTRGGFFLTTPGLGMVRTSSFPRRRRKPVPVTGDKVDSVVVWDRDGWTGDPP